MAGVGIRRAEAGDAAAIAAVHVAAWRESYAGLLPERVLGALSVEDRTRRWHRILAIPDPAIESAVLVACAGQTVVGFGSCGRQRAPELVADGFAGEFSALYLLRSHQGRGVGRALMAELARDLIARGLPGAALWVLRDNQPARGFYEALGGAVVGARVEPRGDAALHEVAYGWRDLTIIVH